ncbi:helix-turn-helix domain-containing protein [uncultured Ruthenibacterium sp.]|uniref:helix-turn-helix domain-containing protein n=1 Tax=uncultured Ruthenibacterium sp. TaxID=1905347 RepID=UPI00349E9BA1
MDFGPRIAALRRQAGLSQEALAEKVGVSRQAIGKWESGTSLPGVENLQELAKALNVSCDELITGQSPQPSQPDGLAAVQELLAEKQRRDRRRGFWRIATTCMLAVCLVCVVAYGAGRISDLRSQVNGLSNQIAQIQGDMNASIGNIRNEIQESLEQQTSLVANWDFSYGAYDPATKTVEVTVCATPKTWTEGQTAQFLFLLDDQPLMVDGEWKDGMFFAKTVLPMADVVSMSVRFSSDEVTQTQQLLESSPLRENFTLQMELYTTGMGASWTTGQKTVTYRQQKDTMEVWAMLPMQDGKPLNWPVEGVLHIVLVAEDGQQLELDRQDVTLCGKNGPDTEFYGPEYSFSIDLEEKNYSVDLEKEFGISPSSSDLWPEAVYKLEYTDAWGEQHTVESAY